MAAPAAIFAKVVITEERYEKTVIVLFARRAVLLPFILVIVMLLCISDGASSHNVSAVDQVSCGRSDSPS